MTRPFQRLTTITCLLTLSTLSSAVLSSAVPAVAIDARVPPQPPRYRLTLLPMDEANDINNKGQIVGTRDIHGILWHKGRPRTIGKAEQAGSYSRSIIPEQIDDQGRVFGSIDEGGGGAISTRESHPFVWEKGKMRESGESGASIPYAAGFARERNKRGERLGSRATPYTFEAESGGHPNDRAMTRMNYRTASIVRGDTVTDIGTLGGRWSRAAAINDRGQVVGISETAKTETHAFLWANGKIHDLGVLTGESGSRASDINNAGGIVGTVERKGGALSRAVLWKNGHIYDLNSLIALTTPAAKGRSESVLVKASAINDAGQIVGQTADHRGFLLTPLPAKTPKYGDGK